MSTLTITQQRFIDLLARSARYDGYSVTHPVDRLESLVLQGALNHEVASEAARVRAESVSTRDLASVLSRLEPLYIDRDYQAPPGPSRLRRAAYAAFRAGDASQGHLLCLALKALLDTASPKDVAGVLAVFEGVDGSGKTTLLNAVKEALRGEGTPVGCYSLPTEDGRDLAMRAGNAYAAQAYLLEDRVRAGADLRGLVSDGSVILQDRGYLSSAVYAPEDVRESSGILARTLCPSPNVTFYLDTPAETCLERLQERADASGSDSLGPTTLEGLREHQRRYEAHLEHSMLDDGSYLVRVPATLPLEVQTDEVVDFISDLVV